MSDPARTGVVVAIDGPSGSGKSSTSRGVAARLGLRYLDTGAMYRAITWWMLRHDVPVDDPAAVAARVRRARDRLRHRPGRPDDHRRRRRRGRGDPRPPRSPAPSRRSAPCPRSAPGCSSCSAQSSTRGGIVVEGRDIGSVVAPDADVKVYLTADAAARAARRAAEEGGADLVRHRVVAAGPRPDRLHAHRLAADHGRGRRPRRQHAVHPRRGRRPHRGARRGRRDERHRPTRRPGCCTAGGPASRWLIRRRYDVREHGTGHVPPQGPVIVAANHTGVIDGPLLAIFGPRPVHALTKEEMFRRPARAAPAARPVRSSSTGSRPTCGAIRTCLHVLEHGGAVGIFPEGNRGAGDLTRFRNGAAYLALVTGAPIVPLMMFGTRPAGRRQGRAAGAAAPSSTWCTARRSGSRARPGRGPSTLVAATSGGPARPDAGRAGGRAWR